MFAANESSMDRLIRAVLGLVLIYVGFFMFSGAVGILLGIVGLIFLITGLVGWCPLYRLFGINTLGSSGKPG